MANQQEVADYFEVDSRTIRNWKNIAGFPQPKGKSGYDIRKITLWRLDYYKRLTTAKPDPAFDPLGNSKEELEIAEKRVKIRKAELEVKHKDFDLSVKEGRFAPIETITRTLELVSVAVASNLEALLPKMKKAWPDIPPDAVETIQKVIAVSRNEVASIEPDVSSYEESDLDCDSEGVEST
ncbi:hypothetical protein [Pseudoalteromonas spongiae]|uniref:hypothetical protein n=1 Tax=Pseudoalteromonas spongiae TaxID=298657 RepID=UPI000C2D19AC|nr:hypothetical protein [Pseudoalteromonas spongiae]